MTRQNLRAFDGLALVAGRIEKAEHLPRTEVLDEMATFGGSMHDQLPEIAARWDVVREARRSER